MAVEHPAAPVSEVDYARNPAQVRRAAIASVVGTGIEWYDYFIFGTAAALIFPAQFFAGQPHYIGLLASFGTLFVGFLARPLGAALFGSMGDRIGRKRSLIVTLMMMGCATTLIGLLPGSETIGLWAPVILVLLRIVQGVAVGGEWSGSVLLSMEWGDKKRRGLMGSLPQMGSAIGLLLGTGLLTLASYVTGASFSSWGWRVPFLLSLVLVGIGLYVRLKVMETPVFAKAVRERKVSRMPVREVVRTYPKEILLCALLRMSEQMPFYIVTAFVLSYLVDEGFSQTFVLVGTMTAAAVELAVVPLAGHLSDTIGRKRIYMIGAGVMGVWGFVYFALIDTGVPWVVFVALAVALIPHGLQFGPQATLIAESFPTRLRYGGAGLGFQLASIIAGGPAALIAVFLIQTFGTPYAISAYILLSAVVTLLACRALPDRSRIDIEDDSAYETPGPAGA
jgi:MFS family permease